MSQEEYIQERVIKQQKWYSGKSSQFKKRFQRLKLLEIILAAIIPFLSALGTDYFSEKNIVVGILGILISISAGILLLYNFQDKWVEYRSTSEMLKSELVRFNTKTGVYKESNNPFDLLVDRVEIIISDENSKWRELVSKRDEK